MHKPIPSLIEAFIQAGFPSAADDPLEMPLDLHAMMVKKPAATFFIRVEGDSMKGAGIYSKDLLVVDRSITDYENKIVVARINDEFTVKRLIKENTTIILKPENPNYPPIQIREEMDFEIWGVVTFAIHAL
jgi:DNA polymerase V